MLKRALAAGSASYPAWELTALPDPLAGLRGREGGEKRRGRTREPGEKRRREKRVREGNGERRGGVRDGCGRLQLRDP